ncbi:MAG: HD domain-containing protein [Elusimicrobiota bacterium]
MSEIRDTIYGFITPSDTELNIINSTLFQRLRKIKQLSLESLVYPGAQHTRFEHSLGVLYIAKTMAEKLLLVDSDSDKIRIIRFAALLHDVGHGPFSHVSEDILDKYSAADENSANKDKIHEKITVKIIETNKELSKVLGSEERKQIVGLLNGESSDLSLMREIVSGPIDADKQDYLLRDSYYCGVKYGVYDFHRLINTLTHYEEEDDKHIAINYDGVNALEQFVLAKYYMTTQVYRHKIRLVSDAMIVRDIELGIEKDGIGCLAELYNYNDSEKYLMNYLSWYDERLICEIIYNQKNGFANEIFSRLNERNLFKTVFSLNFKNFPETIPSKVRTLMADICNKENKGKKILLESGIANILGTEPEFTIVYVFKFKSVKKKSGDSEGQIMVIQRDGRPNSFEQESTVFRAIDGDIDDIIFEIYAPMDYSNDLDDKIKKLSKFKRDIVEYLSSI